MPFTAVYRDIRRENDMSITKQLLKSKHECKVRFHLTASEAGNAGQIALVGDFNNWDTGASIMRRLKNGDFALEMKLPAGGTFKFRYLADEKIWLNDPQADGYEHCDFAGTDNSLLTV